MNFKTTLFLVVLLAIVGVFLFWDKDHEIVDVDVANVDQTKQPLLSAADFDKEKIASVTIEKDGKTLEITKQGSDWFQTKPVNFKLNTWSASQPGEKALGLTYTEKLGAGQNDAPSLADVKLDTPLAIVTVKFDDETKEQVFKLGRKSVGGRGYLMINEDKTLYVVSDDLHKAILDDDLNDWRNKSLKAPTEGQLKQITKTDSHGKIQMVKADSHWTFAANHTGRASKDEITSLLGAVSGIYISKFVADKPADLSAYGLDKPTLSLSMQLPKADEKSEPQYKTFTIGGAVDLKKEHYFATFADGQGVGDVVFQISKTDYEKFDKHVDALRDGRITTVAKEDITKVKYDVAGKTVLGLAKDPEGWGYADPKPGFGVDQELVNDLLGKITDAKTSKFVVNPKFDGKPQLKISLSATGLASDDVLTVYQAGNEFTVIRNNETVGYVLEADDWAGVVNTQIAKLRNRVIKDWKPADLKTLDVTLPQGEKLSFARSDAAWKLKGYDEHEAIALAELLDQIAPLKAASWDMAVMGDAIYTITYGDDKMKLTLKVDAKNRVAQLVEPKLTFKIDQAFADKLTAELRPRTIVDLRRDKMVKVQVVTKDQNVTINQKDGKFIAQGIELDEDKAGALFDTLAGLRVERYVPGRKISRPIEVIITTAEKTVTLNLSDDQSGQIGSKHFELSADDFEKLTAKLAK